MSLISGMQISIMNQNQGTLNPATNQEMAFDVINESAIDEFVDQVNIDDVIHNEELDSTSVNILHESRFDNVHIRGCHNSKELTVRTVRDRARVLYKHHPSFSGWIRLEFYTTEGILVMFGILENNGWYFLEIKHGKFYLFKNLKPNGNMVNMEDSRVFRYEQNVLTKKHNLLHLATNHYVTTTKRGRIFVTSDRENALDICLH